MSRRTLLGAGGVAAVGAGAVAAGETQRGRRWLHSIGIVSGPDLEPPDIHVAVREHELASHALLGTVSWALAAPKEPEAILLCLHGRHASHSFAFDDIGVHRFVAGAGLPWAVASVDGGASSYWHPRADGTDAQAMIFDELLPTITDVTGDLPVLLLGWSMGGYGALLAASEQPDGVHAVAASSPATWRTFEAASPGAFDSAADFAAHDLNARESSLRAMPVRIDCGNDDPFIANVKALAAAVADESDFGEGFHDAGYWRSRVPSQLDFFQRSLRS